MNEFVKNSVERFFSCGPKVRRLSPTRGLPPAPIFARRRSPKIGKQISRSSEPTDFWTYEKSRGAPGGRRRRPRVVFLGSAPIKRECFLKVVFVNFSRELHFPKKLHGAACEVPQAPPSIFHRSKNRWGRWSEKFAFRKSGSCFLQK